MEQQNEVRHLALPWTAQQQRTYPVKRMSWKLWQHLERTACEGAGDQVVSILQPGPNMMCTVTVIMCVCKEVRSPFSHGDERFFFFFMKSFFKSLAHLSLLLLYYFLTCSWFTMLYKFQAYSKVIHLYINIYIFRFFSLIGYYKILNRVLCAIQCLCW